MKLTNDQLAFLARFAKSPDGREFFNILTGYLSTADQKLRTATGEEIFRQQGRAQQLTELLSTVTTAETNLTRARSASLQTPRSVNAP